MGCINSKILESIKFTEWGRLVHSINAFFPHSEQIQDNKNGVSSSLLFSMFVSPVGTSNRTQKTGVFPGNYVTLARGSQRSPQSSSTRENSSGHRSNKNNVPSSRHGTPPELPPRSISPGTAATNAAVGTSNPISMSWHGHQDNVGVPIGRSSSAIMASQASKPSDKVGFSLFCGCQVILLLIILLILFNQ